MTVFHMAYSCMLKYAPAHSPAAAEKCIQHSYIIAANNLQIQHISWHVPNTGGRGHLSCKAMHNSWVNLGKSIVIDNASSVAARTNSQPINMAAEAAKKAQASDAQAPWAVESITLQSLPDFFAHDCLPDEFSLYQIECSRDPMLMEIYEWVFTNFDREKPIHKIALLAGIYFSHVLPNMFWDVKDKPSNDKMLGERSATNAIRNMPWKSNKGMRKGSMWRPQFIVMVPAYIISVYERESPLREYLAKKKVFPSQWNAKNSTKGIGSLNLVQMGLVKAHPSHIIKGGAPLADWVLLTNEKLTVKYKELMGLLQDHQYRPFKIAVSFFGLNKAVDIGATTGTYTNHLAMTSITLKKRPAPDTDFDSEVKIIEHVQHKQHRQ
ncbi:hypothetical protein BDR06DRAFT_971875 [Suillus hirtellus]|nr:hypothetical protein BDR06DRAFT_971875 [Suillus hirtellus]